MKLTGAQILVGSAGARRGDRRVRLPGRRDSAGLRRDARLSDPSRPGPPRAGRDAHGRRLRARERQGRRRDRDLGPGRDQHGHRHRHGDDGLVADRLHHRPGRQQADRLRRVPGNRHHRHHAADHQAQLPGDERGRRRAGGPRGVRGRASPGRPGPVLVDITKDAQQASCEVDWDAAEPHLTEALRRCAAGRRRLPRRARADQRRRAAADSRRPRRDAVGRRARDRRARRARADSDRGHAARHRRRRRRRIR